MGVREVVPMPGPCRSGWVTLVAVGLAGLLACSASAPPVLSCATGADCPALSRCRSGACVRNAPPAAAVALPPAPLETNVLLSFDASASADPDDGDAVASFAWTFRALSGEACAPPTVAGTGPVATVRFACPGRWAVDVTATDEMGATATATKVFDVAAYGGPALVTVGADVTVGHVCTPAPSCTPSEPVNLSASTPGIAPGQVHFAWTVEPPADRPLTSARRVSFSPSATVASPVVALETDGDAISGDWIFRVVATDAAGVIGTAAIRVSVANRPPTVTKTIPLVPHSFEGSVFYATADVPFTVSDPDGDTVLGPTVEAHHTGDGGASFSATLMGDPLYVNISIVVPYSAPEDAHHLIGGAGLERTVLFDVSDVNGGRTIESWPIGVGNRPPVLVDEPPPFAIDHAYDPVGLAYVADAPLSTWTDPDGDPLSQVPGSGTGDPACPELVVETVARARCRLPFVGAPAVGNFAGTHTVTQAIQDPWAPATTTSTVAFTIENRPPTITSTATYTDSSCVASATCCRTAEGICEAYLSTAPGTARVPSRWADPDGDPISVEAGAVGSYTPVQPLVCVPSACVLEVSIAPMTVCFQSTVTYLPTTIGDGLATASGSLPMQVTCY